MYQAGRRRVVMLAKPPLAGRVKTRLTAGGELSEADAAAWYGACLGDLASRLAGQPDYELLVCGPAGLTPPEQAALRQAVPAEVAVITERARPGRPGDLGAVMAALAQEWWPSGCGGVAFIGSDCALLEAPQVSQGVAALGEAEVVLGPDQGGGCWLIGFGRRVPILTGPAPLGAVRWSQGTDYRELQQRAACLGYSTISLATAEDVDEPADLERLERHLVADRDIAAPRLRRWFAGRGREGEQANAGGDDTGPGAGADTQSPDDPVLPDAAMPGAGAG